MSTIKKGSNYVISINQLADFSVASEAKKRRIIRQQKKPNKFLVSWYQLSKSRIKKTLENNCDLTPVIEGIKELVNRKPTKPRQVLDRQVSIQALERFVNIKLPTLLKDIPYEIIKKVDAKSIIYKGVEIIVSPEVIFKLKIKDKEYLGAVKIHISKNNIFDNNQSRCISSLLYKYLNEVVVKNGEKVMPELCLSIDVFGEKVIPVPRNVEKKLGDIEILCEEVKSLWQVA